MLVLITFGCKKVPSSCYKSSSEWHELNGQIETIEIKLDSLQVVGWMTPIQLSENKKYLIIFDDHNKRLFYYDIDAGFKFEKCINLDKKALPNKIMNFVDIGGEEILFYNYQKHELLWYSLSSNEVLRKRNFEVPDSIINPFNPVLPSLPYFSAASPMTIQDSLITGFGYYAGEREMENPENRTVCTVLNFYNDKKEYKIIYPKLYWIDNWGGMYFRAIYACFNPKKDNFIVSFPADQNLHVFDNTWKEMEINGGSRQNICIDPMKVSRTSKKLEDREYVLGHYLSNSSYGAIIYDSYRDQYWRVLEMPVSTEDLQNIKSPEKRSYLVLMDNSFKYIGELALPKGIVTTNYFVTKDGIYFLNLNNKNEDIASFYKINKYH